MAEKKNWIAGAIGKPGALRKELGVKRGEGGACGLKEPCSRWFPHEDCCVVLREGEL